MTAIAAKRSGPHPARSLGLAVLAGGLLAASAFASAQEPPRPIDTSAFGEPGARCAELRYADFADTPEALTQITDARPIEGANGVPSYCQVEGYVWRATRFRLRFPLQDWNGKMVVMGTGGQAGGLPVNMAQGQEQLRLGYAVANHDGGHFSTITDTKWSYFDDSAALDFSFRSPYLATVASKAALARFHERDPARTYYLGCSNGGREAMMMAQVYPHAFDGIVAGAPSIAAADLFLNMFWVAELVRDQSRDGFDMAAARTLHGAALEQCDALDGRRDGVIDEPRRCRVDFSPIRCKGRAGEQCLTDRQIDIARKIYEGPRTPEGRQIAPSSAFPGSEIAWVEFITPRWTIGYAHDVFRYQAFTPAPGPKFVPRIEDIAEYAERMGAYDRIASATNPDLGRFQARGGKLIAYYGWSDAFGGARSIMDYYDKAERVAGGEARAGEFFRLFMVPGMDHCGGGSGPSVFDWLAVLDGWVERGQAPETVTGYHLGPDRKPTDPREIGRYRSGGPDPNR